MSKMKSLLAMYALAASAGGLGMEFGMEPPTTSKLSKEPPLPPRKLSPDELKALYLKKIEKFNNDIAEHNALASSRKKHERFEIEGVDIYALNLKNAHKVFNLILKSNYLTIEQLRGEFPGVE